MTPTLRCGLRIGVRKRNDTELIEHNNESRECGKGTNTEETVPHVAPLTDEILPALAATRHSPEGADCRLCPTVKSASSECKIVNGALFLGLTQLLGH